MTKLYVYKNLTHQRKKLLRTTKQKAKSCEFKYVWINNGKICVRKEDDCQIFNVFNESDLVKIFDQIISFV